jgi:hypothetical protein
MPFTFLAFGGFAVCHKKKEVGNERKNEKLALENCTRI